ncbi:MAG: LacI family transcriptional regulator [Variovorax sp.]|nr:MAG: LacI family transcriptional regulator [Variovorax sp.]
MTKSATSRDVARLANVSQTTVSRVLQGSARVDPVTREAVMNAIRQLGYLPSPAARAMRTNRTGTVALVVASLTSNPLYPALLQLLSSELRRNALHATVWEADRFGEDTARSLVESPIDGVIVATAVNAATPFLAQVAQRKPMVLVNRTVASEAFDQVTSDNAGGGRAVAAYFCDGGRRRIGLLSAQDYPASTIQDREAGFTQELLRRGVALAARDIARVRAFSYQEGLDAATAMMASGEFDAIFCVNDILGIGALDALRRGGIRVPARTWVVGYDDIPMCAWECVSLSTVRQPMEEMVAQAVAVLLRRLAGDRSPHQRIELPNAIVHRRSTVHQP